MKVPAAGSGKLKHYDRLEHSGNCESHRNFIEAQAKKRRLPFLIPCAETKYGNGNDVVHEQKHSQLISQISHVVVDSGWRVV